MAEELRYGSDSSANKRKFDDDDQTPPPPRRQTGFSAPIASQSPTGVSSAGRQPASYNSVPPPMDEIQLAKQKAQEIAARLLSNAEAAAKKPRVENGGDAADEGFFQKTYAPSVPPPMSSYGYPGTSKKIEIPSGRVGVIIGKGGETIKYLQAQSGAKIQVTRDMDADPNSPTRSVELMGTPEQISRAEKLIREVIDEADAGGSGLLSRRLTGEQIGADQFVMKVPNNRVGLVIGKGGESIKNMQARSGARIQVIPLHLPPGDTSTERTVQIDGTSEQIEAAKQLINEVIGENRLRNPAMAGTYSQQGYQARPPTNWAPPGAPLQQSGYGYLQPGAYPGSAPPYGTNQPPYPSYPPQSTSGGYATGWDQSTAPSSQQPVQVGGYDYYGQQPPLHQQQAAGGPGAATDGNTYAYNQQPASGYNQGYPHGGYSIPQSGYGQPQPNAFPGYDQQQNYSSTTGYASASNPPPDGHTPSYGPQGDGGQVPSVHSSTMGQQSYASNQQPSPGSGYPPQGSTQPGYELPPSTQGGYGTQTAAGYSQTYAPPHVQQAPSGQTTYGQPQQSPSAQGGYDQPSSLQPGYPPTQSSYAPPESVAQRPPSTGYAPPSGQPGYGAPSYGAPSLAQPQYGQQQAPAHNATYGGGYSQPQAYSSDGTSGGTAWGTNDSTPPSQAATQQSATTKASPPS